LGTLFLEVKQPGHEDDYSIIQIILKAWIFVSSPSILFNVKIIFVHTSGDYHVPWK
jgi:hypothetical protein